jgi:hypothetical protein
MILFLLVCVLAVAPYALPVLGPWPIVALLVVFCLDVVKQASAGRSSGEAVSPDRERE